MSHSNGKITKPVSIYDVQQVLGVSSADLATLCAHKNNNMFAKCKPIKADLIRPLNYDGVEQSQYQFGLSVVASATESAFIAAVKAAFSNSDYQDKDGHCQMVKYLRPTGGMASPYRLSDYDGYVHGSYLDFAVPNGEASGESHGDGLPVSSVYSWNQDIDLSSGASDVTLPDDTARLAYYRNFMANDLTRAMLHVYDLIMYAVGGSTSMDNFTRGILLWNDDVTDIFYNTSGVSTILPWASDTELLALYGSPTGKDVHVVEFYYNRGTIGPKFLAIPVFSYITQCFSEFVFAGMAIGGSGRDGPDYIAISISMFEAKNGLDTFSNLWLGLEFCDPEYNSATGDWEYNTWEEITLSTGTTSGLTYDGWITVRYNGVTKALSTTTGKVVGSYEYDLNSDGKNEGVTRVDAAWTSGRTAVRLVIYGSLTNSSSYKTFYTTPQDNWYIYSNRPRNGDNT